MDEAPQLIHTLLQHLSALFARESDQILLEQLGIGFAQYKILSSVQASPATQQKHIAFNLGQTEASISRQIKLLHTRGLLTTRVNPQNKREHITSLTQKGQRLTAAAQEVLQSYQRTSVMHIPPKQQAQLLELMSQLPSK